MEGGDCGSGRILCCRLTADCQLVVLLLQNADWSVFKVITTSPSSPSWSSTSSSLPPGQPGQRRSLRPSSSWRPQSRPCCPAAPSSSRRTCPWHSWSRRGRWGEHSGWAPWPFVEEEITCSGTCVRGKSQKTLSLEMKKPLPRHRCLEFYTIDIIRSNMIIQITLFSGSLRHWTLI